MKKLFNDNAKTIAIVALIGCAVLAVVLYKQNKKNKPCNPALDAPTKVATEPAAETPAEETTETK